MITKMKKLTFLVYHKEYDAFLNMDTPKDKNIEKMIYILKYAIDHNRDLFIHI